jgi:hypothetical protein
MHSMDQNPSSEVKVTHLVHFSPFLEIDRALLISQVPTMESYFQPGESSP